MKVLVDLNSKVNSFNLKEEHKVRLQSEFTDHEFIFMNSYKELKSRISEADAALVWVFPEHLYAQAKELKSLYTPAAGKNWVAEDPSGNVEVFFSKFHGQIISESFLTMLLYNNNQLKMAVKLQAEKEWGRNAFIERSLLKNQKLLIIGFGEIGKHCARKAKSLGMEVVGVKRSGANVDGFKCVSFEEISEHLGDFDHVLNLLPGNPSTERLICKDLIKTMKIGASFYNFGRGTTVDENALIESLESGGLSFAGLDVTDLEPLPKESSLWDLENVLITPHSSCCYNDYLHLFIDELKTKL